MTRISFLVVARPCIVRAPGQSFAHKHRGHSANSNDPIKAASTVALEQGTPDPQPGLRRRLRNSPCKVTIACGSLTAGARRRRMSRRDCGAEVPRHGPTNLPVRGHVQISFHLCLPELRGHHSALAGQVRILRRVEHHHRGSGGARGRRRRGAAGRRGPAVRARGSVGRLQDRAAPGHRPRRNRPGRRRRLRPGVGDADRRRAGHRQVDASDSGLRRGRAIRGAGRLCFR